MNNASIAKLKYFLLGLTAGLANVALIGTSGQIQALALSAVVVWLLYPLGCWVLNKY